MSGSVKIKDVRENALRLMETKDFKGALTNWNYIKRNSEETDPVVLFNLGK
jgi:hypothetical protein